ncbi:MAG: hypothetical protein COT17_07640 [Elusimicrobia bacterium CG08_land_8_20_14_0_20_51_18]|nr:MAG: hypothetical protein COT17_07640 [Elusimicrobia bacterium CG08_land_8_20_14_0_20_51_18]
MNDFFLKRTRVIAFLLILTGLAIAARLFYLQIILNKTLSGLGDRQFKREVSEIGARGRILDCSGEVLADSIVTWDIIVMKRELLPEQKTVETLAKILKKNRLELEKKIRKAKNYVRIARKTEREVYDALSPLIAAGELKGVIMDPHQQRLYPSGTAREITGLSNEEKGLTQIELIYDKYLKGSTRTKEVIRDAGGNAIYDGKERETREPSDIYLTIDNKIQFITQETVAKYARHNNSDLAIGLVQDPKTGRILAMASYPENHINLKSVEWVYEPGSTFKTITLSASLEEKTVSPKDVFYCENGAWKFNSRTTIHDHEPEKDLTLAEVFEKSSNIGFAKIGMNLGIEKLYLYMKSFGFGSKTGLEFTGESRGLLRELRDYKPIDLAVTSYGHSIGVTPLQMINAYSAIAHKGLLLQPSVLDRIIDPASGDVLLKTEYREIRKAVSEEIAEKVTKMLVGVVDRGTGRKAQIIGYSVAGKTGTSNKLDMKTGKYLEKQNVASFCGFFPASDPQYTILIIMDNPKKFYYGGETAAPAFAEIAKKIITLKNIKPDRPFNYKDAVKTSYSPTISD